jgi:hypothetical protein
MMMTNNPVEPTAEAVALYKTLEGLSLADADAALDQARQVVWWFSFSGAGIEATVKAIDPTPVAARIAQQLEGKTIKSATELVEDVRLILWTSVFANVKGSHYHEASIKPATGPRH